MHRFCLSLVLFLTVTASGATRSTESTVKWREDLETFRRELPRTHRNLFHRMSRDDFDRAVSEVSGAVPGLDDHQIVVALGKIVARVGDGHTHINFGQPAAGFRMLPVRFHQFSDGIYIRASEQPDLAGSRLVAVEGRPAAEVWSSVAAVTPRDNESGMRQMNAVHLAVPEILHALGIVKSRDSVTLRVARNGVEREVTLTPKPIREVWRMKMTDARPANSPEPLYAQSPDSNFWHRYDEAAKLLYAKYNSVYWMKDEAGEYEVPGRVLRQGIHLRGLA